VEFVVDAAGGVRDDDLSACLQAKQVYPGDVNVNHVDGHGRVRAADVRGLLVEHDVSQQRKVDARVCRDRAVIDVSQDDQVVEGRAGGADLEVAVVVDGGGADSGDFLGGDQAAEQADRGGIGLGLRLLGRAGDLSVDRAAGDQRGQRDSSGREGGAQRLL
jgi:hypothetical protein